VKKVEAKGETGTPSKGNQRTALEAVLRTSMMNVLDSYDEDEVMSLYERVKGMYDVVRTRTLLLPREKRLTAEEKEYMQEALAHLAETKEGVVDGEEEEDEEDDLDIDQLDSESDSEEDDEKISAYINLFKKRLVLNDIHESHNTAEDDDFMDFDDDFDLEDADDVEGEESSEEEVVIPAKKGKKAVEAPKKGDKQLAVSKRPVAVADSDDEEDDEDDGDLDGMLDDEEMDSDDGFASSRNFFANFTLLNTDGKPGASQLILESSDVYTGESGFQGTHQLTWNDDVIFALNVVDGDIVEPEMPELGEDMDEDEFDDEMLAGGVPNSWDADAALALKQACGFPEELTALQFVVIMTRVMSRIIKNAARERGPAPADGLLPFLVLELAQLEMAADGESGEDDASSEEEEPVKPVKKEKHEKPAAKPEQKKEAAKPQHSKKEEKPQQQAKKEEKPHHAKKEEKKEHHQAKNGDKKPSHQGNDKKPHHSGDKPHHGGDKKHHSGGDKPHHGGDKKQHHSGGDKKHHEHNDKKRSAPHGNRDSGDKHQHKKHHGGKKF
jgi:hypothetical protein